MAPTMRARKTLTPSCVRDLDNVMTSVPTTYTFNMLLYKKPPEVQFNPNSPVCVYGKTKFNFWGYKTKQKHGYKGLK